MRQPAPRAARSRRPLCDLLLAMFTASEMRRFLALQPVGDLLLCELPELFCSEWLKIHHRMVDFVRS